MCLFLENIYLIIIMKLKSVTDGLTYSLTDHGLVVLELLSQLDMRYMR